jgi:hypothetical protein
VLAPTRKADARIGRGIIVSVKIGRTAGDRPAVNQITLRDDSPAFRSGSKAWLADRRRAQPGGA